MSDCVSDALWHQFVCLPEEERLARDASWEPLSAFPGCARGSAPVRVQARLLLNSKRDNCRTPSTRPVSPSASLATSRLLVSVRLGSASSSSWCNTRPAYTASLPNADLFHFF